jgi:hypothetical protein
MDERTKQFIDFIDFCKTKLTKIRLKIRRKIELNEEETTLLEHIHYVFDKHYEK